MSDDLRKQLVRASHATSEIAYPGMHDVMLGRGGEANSHSGNVTFRQFVKQFKEEYLATPRQQKPEMALKVVHHWRNLDPPGRFLTRTYPNAASSTWHEVGDELATKRALKNLGERDTKPRKREISFVEDSTEFNPKEGKVSSYSEGSSHAASSALSSSSGDELDQQVFGMASLQPESPPLMASYPVANLRRAVVTSSPVEASPLLNANIQEAGSAPSIQQLSASMQAPAYMPLEQYWPLPFQTSLQMPFNPLFPQSPPPPQQQQQQHLQHHHHHQQQQQDQQLPRNAAPEQSQELASNLYLQDRSRERKTEGEELPTAAALTKGIFNWRSDDSAAGDDASGSEGSER